MQNSDESSYLQQLREAVTTELGSHTRSSEAAPDSAIKVGRAEVTNQSIGANYGNAKFYKDCNIETVNTADCATVKRNADAGSTIMTERLEVNNQSIGVNMGHTEHYEGCDIETANTADSAAVKRDADADIKTTLISAELGDQSIAVNKGSATHIKGGTIGKLLVTDEGWNSAFKAKYKIPNTEMQYVPRKDHEAVFQHWLKTAQAPAMLRISGPKSAGKTFLATAAATMATKFRFGEVIWVEEKLCQGDDNALEQLYTEILIRYPQLTAEDSNVLLVLDNVVDDVIIEKFHDAKFVIATTTNEEIGNDSNFGDQLQPLEVKGLTDAESEQLVQKILKKEEFAQVKSEGRWSKVMEMCHRFDNFPWSVQEISVKLSKDHGFWKKENFGDYTPKLIEEIVAKMRCSNESPERMGIPAHTGYF